MKTLKVIKIGGNIINNEDSLLTFLKGFSSLKDPKILVHGGGKLASDLSNKLNIPVQLIDGRRVTNAETLDIITMVYAGKINKNIVTGNERVINPRLDDARFFISKDLDNSIFEKKDLLKKVIFHKKLGSMLDKVQRISELSELVNTPICL